ncbi:MAG: response regulator [Deltaproteobacteria bacterium]|nr:MAG: response regulator [Deltaproteobacteria bacterium]
MTSAAPVSSTIDPPTHIEGGGRVLVIDDSLTILKVISTILAQHGYEVATAGDGREGLTVLNAAGPFDVILLDFVMPRMNGYQFCRELRSDPNNKHMPVVLMSARTASIGDRFVEQTGAVDALSKPFDARALIAVVGAVLAKRDDPGSRLSMPSPDMMGDEEDLDAAPESGAPPSRHFRSLERLTTQLASAVAPHVKRLHASEMGNEQVVANAIALGLNHEVLLQLAGALDELDMDSPAEILRGSLSKLPVADVLQLLQMRHQTGVVTVRHKKQTMTLAIREGMLDFAQAVGVDEKYRIGRYFVEKGWLDREQLGEVLEQVDEGTLLGEWLVSKSIIDEEMLTYALANQSAELVYELLRWPEGRFILSETPFSAEAEKAALGLGMSELVLEGFRRVDEWRLMADTIDFNAVLVVDQVTLGTLDESKMGKAEQPILEAIDGQRSVREIMEESALTSFDAIKAIYGFIQSRVVREVKQALNKSIPPPAPKAAKDEDGDDEGGSVATVEVGADEEPVLEVIEES